MRDFITDQNKKITDLIIDKIEQELEEIDTYELYDDMLNETSEHELPFNMSYAKSMKENDKTMYNCGYNDYMDFLEQEGIYIEINDSYYLKDEVNDCKQDFLEDF